MKKSKVMMSIFALSTSVLLLAACSNSAKSMSSSSSSSSKVSQSSSSKSKSSSSSNSSAQASQSSSTAPVATGMNLQEIAQGNYTSIAGTWKSASGMGLYFTDTTAYDIYSTGNVEQELNIDGTNVNGLNDISADSGDKGAPQGGPDLFFIPKGVQLGLTDSSKDRIFETEQSLEELIPSDQYYAPAAINDVLYKQ